MPVIFTVLIFLVAPLGVVLLAYALVMVPAARNRFHYKPGKPWDHAPVWYEPHPVGGGHAEDDDDDLPAGATALGARVPALAIGQGAHPASGLPPARTASGGARGTW